MFTYVIYRALGMDQDSALPISLGNNVHSVGLVAISRDAPLLGIKLYNMICFSFSIAYKTRNLRCMICSRISSLA